MKQKRRISRSVYSLPYIVGEGQYFPQESSTYRNTAYKNARNSRNRPTAAERSFEQILNGLNRGVLKGRFIREYTIANKWNLDFYFPDNRLAVEVDGSIHSLPDQQIRDREKEQACHEWDITLIRLRNQEVFGDRETLVGKLRQGWKRADRKIKTSHFGLKFTFGRPAP